MGLVKWQDLYRDKLISVEEAAKLVKSGDTVVFSLSSQPKEICMAIASRMGELRNVNVRASWSQEHYPWHDEGVQESIQAVEFFGYRHTTRPGLKGRWIDWLPHVPGLMEESLCLEPRGQGSNFSDVAYFAVGEPNKAGYFSFGHDVWYVPSMARTAKVAVAVVDPDRIWTYGETIHVSEVDYLVEAPKSEYVPPAAFPIPPQDEVEVAQVIGSYVVDLIKDGDTLEIGTGTASEAVLDFLGTKNDLGYDTEVLLPQAIDLVKSGVITGKKRNVNRGKVLCSAIQAYMGHPTTMEAIAFVDHNLAFEFRDMAYMTNPVRIASNDNMVAVNSLLRMDLLGQGVATHFGSVPICSPGGLPEYMIGAHYSKGGRTVSTLMSTAQGGSVCRVVPQFEPGTMVTVPMFYIDYLVTEQGVVNLTNKTRRERADAIISVVSPEFQPELKKAARKLFWP